MTKPASLALVLTLLVCTATLRAAGVVGGPGVADLEPGVDHRQGAGVDAHGPRPAALPEEHPDRPGFAVHVLGPQLEGLGDPEPAPVEDGEQGPVADAAGRALARGQEGPHFGRGENLGGEAASWGLGLRSACAAGVPPRGGWWGGSRQFGAPPRRVRRGRLARRGQELRFRQQLVTPDLPRPGGGSKPVGLVHPNVRQALQKSPIISIGVSGELLSNAARCFGILPALHSKGQAMRSQYLVLIGLALSVCAGSGCANKTSAFLANEAVTIEDAFEPDQLLAVVDPKEPAVYVDETNEAELAALMSAEVVDGGWRSSWSGQETIYALRPLANFDRKSSLYDDLGTWLKGHKCVRLAAGKCIDLYNIRTKKFTGSIKTPNPNYWCLKRRGKCLVRWRGYVIDMYPEKRCKGTPALTNVSIAGCSGAT